MTMTDDDLFSRLFHRSVERYHVVLQAANMLVTRTALFPTGTTAVIRTAEGLVDAAEEFLRNMATIATLGRKPKGTPPKVLCTVCKSELCASYYMQLGPPALQVLAIAMKDAHGTP